MPKVPTLDQSEVQLKPTPIDPKTAATLGGEIVDVGQGLSSIGDAIQKSTNLRQKYQADAYMSSAHGQKMQMIYKSNDLDNLDSQVNDMSAKSLETAANMIQDPTERDTWLDKERDKENIRNIQAYRAIDLKQNKAADIAFDQANSADGRELRYSSDPGHMGVVEQGIRDRYTEYASSGALHPKKSADDFILGEKIKGLHEDILTGNRQVLEGVAKQLQMSTGGMYSGIPKNIREDNLNKLFENIKKIGTETKFAYTEAQNNTDDMLLSKLDSLNPNDLNDARAGKYNGIPATPEVADAVEQAMLDPFVAKSKDDVLEELHAQIGNVDIPARDVKLNILRSRQITASEKSALINQHLRVGEDGKSKSIDQLVKGGVEKNRREILSKSEQINDALKTKRGHWDIVHNIFHNYTDDNEKINGLYRDLDKKLAEYKGGEEADMVGTASELVNNKIFEQLPDYKSFPQAGKMYHDSTHDTYRIFYPNKTYIDVSKDEASKLKEGLFQ